MGKLVFEWSEDDKIDDTRGPCTLGNKSVVDLQSFRLSCGCKKSVTAFPKENGNRPTAKDVLL